MPSAEGPMSGTPTVVPYQAGLPALRRPRSPVSLSPLARSRLATLDWYRARGGDVSGTARHFGSSRRPQTAGWPARGIAPPAPRAVVELAGCRMWRP